jgi:hypothetical protein
MQDGRQIPANIETSRTRCDLDDTGAIFSTISAAFSPEFATKQLRFFARWGICDAGSNGGAAGWARVRRARGVCF